jgi:UDP-N-acetylglucosamine 2-epimerase (non-hydrolysing)
MQTPICVWTVFGTRPEAIKMLPLVLALKEDPRFKPVICVTAQHRDMLDQVLDVFEQKANIDLNIMTPGQTLSGVTTAIVTQMNGVLESPPIGVSRPDCIMVHGDTTTTFSSALSAFYHGIPVWHVEAGLRTWDMGRPFPEEGNRQLTRVLASYHLAPTETARKNILKEGVSDRFISVTGNTVIDALLWMQEKLRRTPSLAGDMQGFVEKLKSNYANYLLVTGHRRESHGAGFESICNALKTIAKANPDLAVVYPVHPNPKVKGPVEDALGDIENIFLIAPQDYAPFVYLMDNSYIIMTDSGGIQEEAPSLGKPVLVLREVTERPEAVEAGTVKLVGTNEDLIVKEVNMLLHDKDYYAATARIENPYGDGRACERILLDLAKQFGIK